MRIRTFRPVVARALGLTALAACLVAPAARAENHLPLPVVGVTAGIPSIQTINPGAAYFKSEFHLIYGHGRHVWLSGASDGTGQTSVDDRIHVAVIHADGTRVTYAHDYSNGCSTAIEPMDPVDLGWMFDPGNNRVVVWFGDECGGYIGTGSTWLVETQADQ
jgi:hypothetical protein